MGTTKQDDRRSSKSSCNSSSSSSAVSNSSLRDTLSNMFGSHNQVRNSAQPEDSAQQSTSLIRGPAIDRSQFLSHYLSERGFLVPRKLIQDERTSEASKSSGLSVSVATSGNDVFLPTLSSGEDEYLSRLNGLREGSVSPVQDSTVASIVTQTASGSTDENHGDDQSGLFEMDDSMTPYNIAVILSINKNTAFTEVHAQLCSRVKIAWQKGVPPSKTSKEELYNAGELDWSLTAKNYNLYVPSEISSKSKIVENNRNLRNPALFKKMDDSKRIYQTDPKRSLLEKIGQPQSTKKFKRGTYVYIIPVVFSNNIPETLHFPSAKVTYRLCIASKSNKTHSQAATTDSSHTKSEGKLLSKFKKQLHISPQNHESNSIMNNDRCLYGEYPISIVRTPPLVAMCTANKSVTINRTWADSLSYEISFPQRYAVLNSSMPIQIKVCPLLKNISVKRVRVSLLETVTFVSKDFAYEYDQIDVIAKDPNNPYYPIFSSSKKKERSVSLLEIRSKEKGARSLKEEIVENCIDENLLAYATANKIEAGKETKVGINEPFTIKSVLNFPSHTDIAQSNSKNLPPYGVDLYQTIELPHDTENHYSKTNVVDFLTHHNGKRHEQHKEQLQTTDFFPKTELISNECNPVKFHTKYNEPKRGIYLSSTHFTNIHSRHKLEVMFRITKEDNNVGTGPKTRNYEVLIEIPISIVSEKCSIGNMQLPTYDSAILQDMTIEEPPPTFEEAISVPSSPVQSPILSSLQVGPEDSSIQAISLSSSSVSLPDKKNSSKHLSAYNAIDTMIGPSKKMETDLIEPDTPYCLWKQQNAPMAVQASQRE